MISAREACRSLGAAGVSKRRALQVLHAGLAGEVIDGRTVTLYDEDRVQALARRDVLTWPEVEDRCPAGFFVSRREFPALAPRDEQLAALAGGWGEVSPWTWLVAHFQIERHGSLPFIATIGGLVVVGAEITGKRGASEFVLQEPGPWFDGMAGCWFATGPGRPWVLHLGPLALERVGT